MKVLITDDSATIRMILKGLLKQLKIVDVQEASDGAAALALVSQQHFDLLLLDIHMPNMNGLDCLAEIKKQSKTANLPVIMISSDTLPTQLDLARSLGAHAYIKKPFRPEGLREAITAAFPSFSDQITPKEG